MFEFDKYSGPDEGLPGPTAPYTPLGAPRERAFLLWGEHCVECAAPDCFATCDLYDARPDRRCRRFEYGIFRNPRFASASGAGAEVRFKRWGKIEARGNALMMSDRRVRWMERLAGLASRAVNPIGRLVSRAVGDIRWAYASFALLERFNARLLRRRDGRLPDAFVIEIYNPGSAAVDMTLGMSIDRSALGRAITADQLPPAMQRRLSIPPGYFRDIVPLDAFRAIVGSGLPFNLALNPVTPDAHLVFLTLDFVAGQETSTSLSAAPAKAALPPAKCVVFDLDNTLWNGILIEGEVTLRAGIVEIFRELDRRGILISIASKNAHDEAFAKLLAFGIEEYVLFPHINWGPKSESLKAIAKAIDIGVDTLIFVDDNPFERAEVEQALPMVETLPDTALAQLLDHPRLAGSATAESAKRRLMYRENMARASEQAAYGDDYEAFLRDCAIRIEIRPDRPEDRERVAELVQRTNQLNFSGRKYSRDDIERVMADRDLERYVLTVEDRFGAYGTVGFCLARRDAGIVRVQDFMLSCRVQGKLVEQALFFHLTQRPDWTADAIEVDFIRTPRNRLAEAVLDKLDFPQADGPRRRSVSPGSFAVDFLTVDGTWPDRAA